MTTYNLFVDQWNQPPVAFKGNWIIARSMDEAVEMVSRTKPDLIVFGNSYFEKDFIDWLYEHGGVEGFDVEFVQQVTGYDHRDRINSDKEK